MKFKTPREEKECAQLPQKNPKLQMLLINIDAYAIANFSKEITITRIYCTKEEEDALYVEDMSKRPKISPHEVWEAADLRSSVFTEDEINNLVNYCNEGWKYHDGSHPVALYHMIAGNTYHFHIQLGAT